MKNVFLLNILVQETESLIKARPTNLKDTFIHNLIYYCFDLNKFYNQIASVVGNSIVYLNLTTTGILLGL